MRTKTHRKLKCLDDGTFSYWTKNQEYDIYFDEVTGEYCVYDDEGDSRSEDTLQEIIHYLASLGCEFELVGKTEQQDKTLRELIEEMSAKRDKWNTDAENLFAKRDRIDDQAQILEQKAADIDAHIHTLKRYL